MPEPRVAAVDWSGAKQGEARHLWIAEWDPFACVVCRVSSASRADAVRYLCDLACRDAQALVGLDFNFSFPEWWLDTCGVAHPAELWEDAPRLETWLAQCQPPFWGRPGRRRPPLELRQEFRATELAASRRPKSVFQIGGAGAVGTASLRGMPALAQLRRAGFAIWPFDRPPGGGLSGDRLSGDRLSGGGPTAAELWPRLAAPGVVKRRGSARQVWLDEHALLLGPGVASLAASSEDAFDAVAAVIFLAQGGRSLLPSLDSAASPASRSAGREGWIAGVPFPSFSASPLVPGAG